MNTNANSTVIAALLADARVGTFTGIISKLKGKVVGGVRYNDDKVHAVILTGFKYDRLVQRSLDALAGVDADDVVAKCVAKGFPVTLVDVEQARTELKESFEKTLAGTNESTSGHVFDPLEVGGAIVRGARVYKCVAGTLKEHTLEPRVCNCRNCTGDDKSPLPGTIYLTGLKIFSTVLEPAPNGKAPASKPRSMVTPAKDEIDRRLPRSKFVQYCLEPGTDFILNAGGTAAVEATKKGFVVNDSIMDVIARAA